MDMDLVYFFHRYALCLLNIVLRYVIGAHAISFNVIPQFLKYVGWWSPARISLEMQMKLDQIKNKSKFISKYCKLIVFDALKTVLEVNYKQVSILFVKKKKKNVYIYIHNFFSVNETNSSA